MGDHVIAGGPTGLAVATATVVAACLFKRRGATGGAIGAAAGNSTRAGAGSGSNATLSTRGTGRAALPRAEFLDYATGRHRAQDRTSGDSVPMPQEITDLLQLLAQAHVELAVHNSAERDRKLLQVRLHWHTTGIKTLQSESACTIQCHGIDY